MKNENEKFEKLLARFRFTQPVADETKKRISRNKSKQFVAVLKKTGGYSFSFGIVASLFFALKKLGMGVSIIKTAIILAVMTTTATGLIIAGVYAAVHHDGRHVIKPEKIMETDAGPRSIEPIKAVEPAARRDSAEVIARRIGVHEFAAVNIEKKAALEATGAMVRELSMLRGEEFTVDTRKNSDAKRYRMLLTGSVERRNGSYIITARVSDVGDSRVIFFSSEEAASAEQVRASCKKLAQNIARETPVKNR